MDLLRNPVRCGALSLLCLLAATPAHAGFDMSAVIIEFPAGGPPQQDIEIISRDKETQYIATEVLMVPDPGSKPVKEVREDDPQKSGILITPSKMVLPAGARKMIRYVLLSPPTDKERIYRVTVKPVVSGLQAEKQRAALKLLVGYETLVIVRPQNPKAELRAERKGRSLTLTNAGNTNVMLQSGQQCDAGGKNCKNLDVTRIYVGKSWTTTLPLADTPAKYNLWDGSAQVQQSY